MPIDGVVVRNIVFELDTLLSNGKIDRISQPEPDEIIISLRNNCKNHKLLLSASPNYPRVHLTEINKQNPIEAPMFCMVLRKHLSGGRIIRVEQYNLDRIIKIYIESYDELGNLSTKIIICEIMGRRSNISLVYDNNFMVIDSIKHLTLEMNSYRQLLPGITYKYPPMQDKLEIDNMSFEELMTRLESASPGIKLGKFVTNNINGFSSLSALEICRSAGLDTEMDVIRLDELQKKSILNSFSSFAEKVRTASFDPCIYNLKTSQYDFYSFSLNCLAHMDVLHLPSISQTIEDFYGTKDKSDRARQKSADLIKVVNNNLSRCYKKLSIQEEKLLECSQREKWRLYGDLIMSSLYNIKKGDGRAMVPNLYEEEQKEVEIPLDIMLSPVENAQHYYKKYNKEKTAELITEKQKAENLQEIQYLEGLMINLESCTEDEEFDEIRSELAVSGYMRKHKKMASRKITRSKPMHFVSSDGIDIYVGKNNVQNDYLSLKFADNNDIWMHTKNIPGSHVIIKSAGNIVKDSTIFEAAVLAAYYSKAKNSSSVPVDYTEKRNIKKPSGAKPGMVIYYTNRTIHVTPDEETLLKIKSFAKE